MKKPTSDLKLAELLAAARSHVITPAERAAQRISFAYGNVSLRNPAITREMVEERARLLGHLTDSSKENSPR